MATRSVETSGSLRPGFIRRSWRSAMTTTTTPALMRRRGGNQRRKCISKDLDFIYSVHSADTDSTEASADAAANASAAAETATVDAPALFAFNRLDLPKIINVAEDVVDFHECDYNGSVTASFVSKRSVTSGSVPSRRDSGTPPTPLATPRRRLHSRSQRRSGRRRLPTKRSTPLAKFCVFLLLLCATLGLMGGASGCSRVSAPPPQRPKSEIETEKVRHDPIRCANTTLSRHFCLNDGICFQIKTLHIDTNVTEFGPPFCECSYNWIGRRCQDRYIDIAILASLGVVVPIVVIGVVVMVVMLRRRQRSKSGQGSVSVATRNNNNSGLNGYNVADSGVNTRHAPRPVSSSRTTDWTAARDDAGRRRLEEGAYDADVETPFNRVCDEPAPKLYVAGSRV